MLKNENCKKVLNHNFKIRIQNEKNLNKKFWTKIVLKNYERQFKKKKKITKNQ